MRRENIVAAVRELPFHPFLICLANSDKFRITHPETVAVGGRSAVVVDLETDVTHTLDIGLLMKLETSPLQTAGTIAPEPNGAE